MGGLPPGCQGLGDWIKDKVIDKIKSIPGAIWDVGEDVKDSLIPWRRWPNAVTDLFHATGGHVEGPGGVDNIPAWLTRGEFVVTP